MTSVLSDSFLRVVGNLRMSASESGELERAKWDREGMCDRDYRKCLHSLGRRRSLVRVAKEMSRECRSWRRDRRENRSSLSSPSTLNLSFFKLLTLPSMGLMMYSLSDLDAMNLNLSIFRL